MPTRRDFLRAAVLATAGSAWALPQFPDRFQRGGRGRMRAAVDPSQIPAYRFKVVPIERWAGLKADFEKALEADGVSRHALMKASLAPLDFALPADLKGARSIVVLATSAVSASADFRFNGQSRSVLVPFQYYQDDWTPERLRTVVLSEILKEPGRKLADVSKRVPLKYLAARSGLGRYGRNNLIYVDGMGSYCLLHAFATDAAPAADPDAGLEILDECRRCHHCDRICPTSCMGRDRFVLDAGRCLTLYSENRGEFPNLFLPSMHHALMGCLKCQGPCPANGFLPERTTALDAVTEEETRAILKGTAGAETLAAVRKRLRLFPAVAAADFGPILKRNLGVLIRA